MLLATQFSHHFSMVISGSCEDTQVAAKKPFIASTTAVGTVRLLSFWQSWEMTIHVGVCVLARILYYALLRKREGSGSRTEGRKKELQGTHLA
jgi:hypothetical protein